MVEERLRQALERRAASVEVSGDAWDRIVGRLEPQPVPHPHRHRRRPRWFLLASMTTITAIALVATLLVRAEGGRSQRVSTISQPSSTPLGSPTTTIGAAVSPAPEPRAPNALRNPTTTIVPAPEAVLPYRGIFPDTADELERIEQAVDQGSQPWRLDPLAVARVYLAALGIDSPEVTLVPSVPDGSHGQTVSYQSGPLKGTVTLAQLPGRDVFYVVALATARFETRRVERKGRTLTLEVAPDGPGRLSVSTRAPGDGYRAPIPFDLTSSAPASLAVEVGQDGPVIVRLRYEPLDTTVHLAEFRVGEEDTASADPVPSPPPAPRPALTPDAKVGPDGIGPLTVGMTMDEVRESAGVPFVPGEGPYCRTLAPDWDPATLPPGFPPRPYDLVFTNDSGGRLGMVSVFRAPVATTAGIAVGSTEEDVLQAYPGQVEIRPAAAERDGAHWLVHRPTDPAMADYSIVFVIDAGGEVVSYRAGLRALAEADEACA